MEHNCEARQGAQLQGANSATSRKSSRREEENEDNEEETSAEREGASEHLSKSGRSKTQRMM